MSPIPPGTITYEARGRAPISSATVVGASVLYLVLATAFTGTRVYTRYTVYQQFWWDDCKSQLAYLHQYCSDILPSFEMVASS